MSFSKPLGSEDESGFSFVKELLGGEPTCAINFDRLQKHPKHGYIIFEFLLCEASQKVNPWTSHPRKYWHLNAQKFISLFQVARDLNAILYLVNYARKGTVHEDKVRVIRVRHLDPQKGITDDDTKEMSRGEFAKLFKALNAESCQ